MAAEKLDAGAFPADGEVVNSRYTVVSKLGQGGMGLVYRATDAQLGEDVALKYLAIPPGKSAVVDRFKLEFTKLAKFPHPNISSAFDFGEDLKRHLFFFTTELIAGKTFFEGTRGLSPLEIEGLIVQTLRALEYLHNYRLVHFDIKPANVLITHGSGGAPLIKVIDFGVADYGFQGRLVGTPGYMSPEMTRREIPDRRSDLYSLGVMWFHILAGVKDSPFRGATKEETFLRHQTLSVPDLIKILADKVTGLPPYTTKILTRLLAKAPDDRFSSAAAVIAEINLGKENAKDRYEIETRETRQSYIADNARFVGRKDVMGSIRLFLQAHQPVRSDAPDAAAPASPRETHDMLWITGGMGLGKSRILDEICHLAQLNGFQVCGAAADDPATWDAMRAAIQHATRHPDESTLLWIDGYDRLAQDPAAAALMEDLISLQDYLRRLRDLPAEKRKLGLVITAAQLPAEISPDWVLHLGLQPFSDEDLAEYVASVTGFEIPPEGLVDGLARYTEGNPFFVTETLRALINQNILFDAAGRWQATTFEDLGVDFSSVKIPGTVSDAIARDYNQLSAPEQQLLGVLSIWNAPATTAQLQSVLGHPIDSAAPVRLLKKGWIDMDLASGAVTIPNPNRRAAIESQLSRDQKEKWHHAIATLLEKSGASDLEQVHWHFAHGHHAKRAVESLAKLARHYEEVDRPLAQIVVLQKLLVRDDVDAAIRSESMLMLAAAYRHVRRLDEAMDVLHDLERALRARRNHHALHARVWEEMAITANKQKKFDDAEAACMRCLQIIQKHLHDKVMQIKIENYLGQIFLSKGAIDRAITTFEKTRAEAAALPFQEQGEISNNDLSNALRQKGELLRAIDECKADMEFFKKAGNMSQYLRSNLMLADIYRLCCREAPGGATTDWAGLAKAALESGIKAARSSHKTEYLMVHYQGLGSLLSDQENYTKALEYYERALDLATRMENADKIVEIKLNMAIVAARLNKRDRAEQEFLALLEYMRLHSYRAALFRSSVCRVHLELGDLYVSEGRIAESQQQLDLAEDYARKFNDCSHWMLSITGSRAQMHIKAGQRDLAKKLLQEIRQSTTNPTTLQQIDTIESTIDEGG